MDVTNSIQNCKSLRCSKDFTDNSGWPTIQLNADSSGTEQGILTNNTSNKILFFFLYVCIKTHDRIIYINENGKFKIDFFHFYFLNTDNSLGISPVLNRLVQFNV